MGFAYAPTTFNMWANQNGIGCAVCRLKTGETVFFYQQTKEKVPDLEDVYLGEIDYVIDTPEMRYNRDLDRIQDRLIKDFWKEYKDKALTLEQLKALVDNK